MESECRITGEDFKDCEQFFSQPLPDILKSASSSLDDLAVLDVNLQALERVSLLLDILGVECFKWPILVLDAMGAEGTTTDVNKEEETGPVATSD